MLFIFRKLIHDLYAVRYLNFSKIFYYAIANIRYVFGPNVMTRFSRPFFISVEPADFCQLRCPQCPVGMAARNKGACIDEKVVFDTISGLRKSLLHVIFYFQGEPLLNPHLAEYVRFAHEAGIYTSTSTNAMLLNSENARKLVESGLDKLIVSVDGATQEVYEQYRKGGKLERALEGIRFVQEWKQKLGSRTPFVEMQFIVFGTNEHQIGEVKRLAKSSGADSLTLKTAQIYDFESPNPLHTSLSRYSRYRKQSDGSYVLKNPLKNRCRRVISGAVLNVKGEVLTCCFDKGSEFSYGSVTDADFMTLWQNKKATDFRKAVYTNRKQFEMCRNCTEK
ncbi:MAG: radical SAM protein [Paludibacteraceae bacterium]|nr:radical SAM protein [Paludibacteraceae bacterium]